MKAIVYYRHGLPDVLRFEEVARPTPGDNQVLLKVRTASVNPLDWHMMKGLPLMNGLLGLLGRSKVMKPGVDVADRVEAVGPGVTRFKPGDGVFGVCDGAFAEFAVGAESKLVLKPGTLSDEQAASAPVAGLTALQGLRDKGKIHPGSEVLVNGAAGGVGSFAVQIAKSFRANVTAVCSGKNVELVESLGADRVIDYGREDFTRLPQRFDLLFDCVGNHSLSERRRSLNPGGICVMVAGPNKARSLSALAFQSIAALISSPFLSRKEMMFLARITADDLGVLARLMESGKVKPILDVRDGLPEVPEAIRYVGTGRTRGKVVIRVAPN